MGQLVDEIVDVVVEVSRPSDDGKVVGLDWKISSESVAAIREINENIRSAEQISGRLTIG